MKSEELPLGFGMALAQHPDAMKKFADMTEDQQAQVLRQVHAVSSKEEMQAIVQHMDSF